MQAPFSDFSEQPCCDFVLGSGSDAAAASSLSDMLNFIGLVFYMLMFPNFLKFSGTYTVLHMFRQVLF